LHLQNPEALLNPETSNSSQKRHLIQFRMDVLNISLAHQLH